MGAGISDGHISPSSAGIAKRSKPLTCSDCGTSFYKSKWIESTLDSPGGWVHYVLNANKTVSYAVACKNPTKVLSTKSI